MPSSELERMPMHVEALYMHDRRGRILSTNEWRPAAAPRFFLGRTSAGHVWRFRADLPEDLVAKLEALCRDEPVARDLARTPIRSEDFIALLASHVRIERIWMGPAYAFPEDIRPRAATVAISEANADLLRGGLDEWLPDVPHRQPFVAAVENGRAVSVCASVRITAAAHEAGVETLPDFRRRGHAASAVAAWAAAVEKTGATPLYSTSFDNIASQSVAATLGLWLFGVDFHVL